MAHAREATAGHVCARTLSGCARRLFLRGTGSRAPVGATAASVSGPLPPPPPAASTDFKLLPARAGPPGTRRCSLCWLLGGRLEAVLGAECPCSLEPSQLAGSPLREPFLRPSPCKSRALALALVLVVVPEPVRGDGSRLRPRTAHMRRAKQQDSTHRCRERTGREHGHGHSKRQRHGIAATNAPTGVDDSERIHNQRQACQSQERRENPTHTRAADKRERKLVEREAGEGGRRSRGKPPADTALRRGGRLERVFWRGGRDGFRAPPAHRPVGARGWLVGGRRAGARAGESSEGGAGL
eukprot:638193-Rhodomonas_salina.14